LTGQQRTNTFVSGQWRTTPATHHNASGQLAARGFVRRFIEYTPSPGGLALGKSIERIRPSSLREFDQIPMRTLDLLRQVSAIAPLLAGRNIVFVADSDAASLVLGGLAASTEMSPASMLLLDFDRRLLARARQFADECGFGHLLTTRAYNVFDLIPDDLLGRFDAFYLNPPYGSRNAGLSARLFLTRGLELVKRASGYGCAILPCDPERPWTQAAWTHTRQFLRERGWAVVEKLDDAHRYHLDDDPELTSATILLHCSRPALFRHLPFQGRRVEVSEIANFYGQEVQPPFPRYINEDSSKDYDWKSVEIGAA
jgi:N4-bis(aminopropyl)spermidine synthase